MNLKAFFDMSYGVYIVTSMKNDKFSGCVVNTVTQVTSGDSPKVIVAINKENYTCEIAKESKKINISMLSEAADLEFISKFGFKSGRDYNKKEACNYKDGINGVPIVVDNVVSYLEGNVINEVDVGTHIIFVLEIKEAEKISEDNPMTYKYYHTVVKGRTPPKASTFIDIKTEKEGGIKMNNVYECTMCGYKYDEEKEGVKFEDLPDDWRCPLCGASKDMFQKI